MNTTTKIWLIVAISLIVGGSIIFVAVMSSINWNFHKLSTTDYTTNTYTSAADFQDISIDTTTAEITFLPSEDGSTRVSCYELEKVPHTVTFDDGKLVIEEKDQRQWYEHIGINFGSPEIKIYLPENTYGALKIDTTTGDVTIPADFTFESIHVNATTGDIQSRACASGNIEIKVTTGDVALTDVTTENDIIIQISTGDVTLHNVKCQNLNTHGTTGDVAIENLIATNQLDIRRTTGDVTFKASDAKTINIRVGTGSVTGNLLSGKTFTAKATTGSVRVPENSPGGTCDITTTTGSIQITVG